MRGELVQGRAQDSFQFGLVTHVGQRLGQRMPRFALAEAQPPQRLKGSCLHASIQRGPHDFSVVVLAKLQACVLATPANRRF